MVEGSFFALFIASVFIAQCWSIQVAYVTENVATGKFEIHDSEVSDWLAKGEFVNAINETGWSYLSVTTSDDTQSSDKSKAYAAGLVEGHLTRDLISMFWINTVKDQFCEEPYTPQCVQLKAFMDENIAWMNGEINNHTGDPYWHMVELFLVQVDGLTDGFFKSPSSISTNIDPFGLFVLSAAGDMEDIPAALKPSYKRKRPLGSGSCSALIKLLPDNLDLFVAHDTWSSYQTMLRILKKYDFSFHKTRNEQVMVPGRIMTMSSYPGVLLSGDDYYLISSGLATQETTIGNDNPNLNKYIVPQTLLEGIRTMVANRLATSGIEWATLFSSYNSGTYNNQWMAVDYNKFRPAASSMPGLLTILEQLPGMVVFNDSTDILMEQKYWPSYNIPFFPEIFNASGQPANVQKYGDWFSYSGSPRAQIFKRDQGNVKDMVSMIKLMRYNDFQQDPLSRCKCQPPYSGENGISARSDLNPASGTYPFGALGHRSHGGTDMKVTNSDMMKRLEFIAISGPTYDQQPPFQWSKADFAAACPHVGQPDVFKFQPIHFNGTLATGKEGKYACKVFSG